MSEEFSKLELLLKDFINEGTSSIKELKIQTDRIREDMTDVKVKISLIQQKLDALAEALHDEKNLRKEDGKNISKNIEKNSQDIENIRNRAERAFNTIEKQIIGIDHQSNPANLIKLEDEIAEIEKRVAEIEKKLSKWIGGLAVLLVVLTFFLGIFEDWISNILPAMIFFM